MKIFLNKEKARCIKIAYISFFGLSVLSLFLSQFLTGRDFVVFGTIASGIAFGAYSFFFFLNLKLLLKHFILFVGNICFICAQLSFVVFSLFLDFKGIRELIFGVLTIMLFLLVSNKTLLILLKRYNTEMSQSV